MRLVRVLLPDGRFGYGPEKPPRSQGYRQDNTQERARQAEEFRQSQDNIRRAVNAAINERR